MAMGFPDKKVALDIVSGKLDEPLVVDENGWKILRVTYEQMEDYRSCRQIMHLLAELLKSNAPEKPEWDEQMRQVNELMLSRSA